MLGGLNAWGADGLVSSRPATYSLFYTFDERGDVAQRTGATGTLLNTDKPDGREAGGLLGIT